MHFATSLKIKFIIFLCLVTLNIEAKYDQCIITSSTTTKFCTVTKKTAATETDAVSTTTTLTTTSTTDITSTITRTCAPNGQSCRGFPCCSGKACTDDGQYHPICPS
ncbi:hypothetical protein F8M41_019247 [Gigaspora margarita]|uniref:Uncharacterized protein n=1 Tax=Gigaspora margarita TaxID=4874 RepID=A0A8H4EKJ8_GIGMA|nr:hypothetical protein F8M41_019247 [Gigaspora margarita]